MTLCVASPCGSGTEWKRALLRRARRSGVLTARRRRPSISRPPAKHERSGTPHAGLQDSCPQQVHGGASSPKGFPAVAKTVNEAFRQFLAETVNLDASVAADARSSRDWLTAQLRTLHERYDDFPLSYAECDIDFGSFARRTKIRELDDVDLISCMKSEGSTYLDTGGALTIYVPDGARLRDLCNDGSNQLNSRKVINRFVDHLGDIPQYAKSAISRNGEAAVLDLVSYRWSFDIVPGFFTSPEANGRTYYVISDGQGAWKKTDPRIDRDRVSAVNRRHSGHVLNALRVIKFWNRRTTMPTIPPYVLECMVLGHYESAFVTCTEYVDLEVAPFLSALASAVFDPVCDPKGIQGDLNTLSFADRLAISARANQDAARAKQAQQAEAIGDQAGAIRQWGSIFGSLFPSYTS